ncbi:MAG: hypothetical protein ABW170_23095 [Candidatus Thiodiazotropha sp. L084R]
MVISTETVLRGALLMLPWIISFTTIYLSTNISNPDRPMLSNRSSIFLMVLGFMLFITGIVFVDIGILEGVIPEFRVVGVGYKISGLILVFYGYKGRGYKLVKIKR